MAWDGVSLAEALPLCLQLDCLHQMGSGVVVHDIGIVGEEI